MDLHYICPMENNGITIPAGTRKEDIKAREKIIKDFYAKWISEHPDKKIRIYPCCIPFDRSNGEGCLQRGETDKTRRQEPEALQRQDVLFFNTTYISGLRRVCLPAWRCKYRSQIQTIRIHSITYSSSPIHPGNGIPYCLTGT